MSRTRICSRQRMDEQIRRGQGVVKAITTIKQDDGRGRDRASLDQAVGESL